MLNILLKWDYNNKNKHKPVLDELQTLLTDSAQASQNVGSFIIGHLSVYRPFAVTSKSA